MRNLLATTVRMRRLHGRVERSDVEAQGSAYDLYMRSQRGAHREIDQSGYHVYKSHVVVPTSIRIDGVLTVVIQASQYFLEYRCS